MATKVIVTLAIGERYRQHWKHNCEKNWRAYGDRHGFDVLCIEEPLDNSPRARARSPAWQKCLILSQEFSQRYERIVWMDCDILINPANAPAVDAGVPLEKVGAVEEFTYAQNAGSLPRQLLDRLYSCWEKSIINYTPQEYYTTYGLPGGFDKVVQTGVLVLSPRHHRAVLESAYFNHEERGGAEWNYEMRPLSYELLKADLVHWIDPRFNQVWTYSMFLNYPFLIQRPANNTLFGRMKRKLAELFGAPSRATVQRACMTTVFLNCFFFHLTGAAMEQMPEVNQAVQTLLDCVL